MFLLDSLLLPPQEVAEVVLDAIATGRSGSQEVVGSAQRCRGYLVRTFTSAALLLQAKRATGWYLQIPVA